MATATMMAAVLGACSNDDIAVDKTPLQKGRVVTLTVTLSPKDDGATTRGLTDPGDGTLTSQWQEGEAFLVGYQKTDNSQVFAKAKVSAVDGVTGRATVTLDLVDPKDGSDIDFNYPYSLASDEKNMSIDQIGTLADVSANYDMCHGDGTLNVDAGVATLSGVVSMTRNNLIWKLKFTDGGADITDDILGLSINDGDGQTYYVTPSKLDGIYVAMNPISNKTVTINAATATKVYEVSNDGITLEKGKFYQSTIALTETAANTTSYRAYSSRTEFTVETIPVGAITVTSGTTTWADGKTYVVNSNVTINSNVDVTGDVILVLCDGASLTVNGTITGDNLSIYGQDLSSGKLDVVDNDVNVYLNSIAIHGGVITVTEGGVMQGIEAMNLDIYHGKVTTAGAINGFMVMGNMRIFGGDITASATGGAALQIYGSGTPGSLTMTGGTFRATGAGTGSYCTGIFIEEGYGEGTSTMAISGGTLIATGGKSSNSDEGACAIYIQGTLTISGNANVTANGGTDAFGTGGNYGINVIAGNSAGGSATISGGTVTATSGPGGMAAIVIDHDLTISGATTQIDATGGDMGEGILSYGDILINGGTITATAGENAIGLEGNTTISGGVVTAIGGDASASSDGDGKAGYDGSLTMTGGKLIATGGAGDGTGAAGHGISAFSNINLTGVTLYEGDATNPATPAADQSACTKRYVIIK